MNNFSMAIELKVMPVATEKYRSTDISGNYADFAKALGGYGERVTEPGEIQAAIRRGIAKTREGPPALLEFITEKAGRRVALWVIRQALTPGPLPAGTLHAARGPIAGKRIATALAGRKELDDPAFMPTRGSAPSTARTRSPTAVNEVNRVGRANARCRHPRRRFARRVARPLIGRRMTAIDPVWPVLRRAGK